MTSWTGHEILASFTTDKDMLTSGPLVTSNGGVANQAAEDATKGRGSRNLQPGKDHRTSMSLSTLERR